MTRPIPMLDDVSLDAVSRAYHAAHQRIASVPVVGLAGDVQQRLGRASHVIELDGVLLGENARENLEKLQGKAAAGEEVTFTADITSALELQKVVIVSAEIEELAGLPGLYRYRLVLRESPPLPPPAELAAFGGLDGVDVGFDTGVLDDVSALADDVQGAVEQVTGALADLEKLASLADLGLGNPLEPVQSETSNLAAVGEQAASAASALGALLGD